MKISGRSSLGKVRVLHPARLGHDVWSPQGPDASTRLGQTPGTSNVGGGYRRTQVGTARIVNSTMTPFIRRLGNHGEIRGTGLQPSEPSSQASRASGVSWAIRRPFWFRFSHRWEAWCTDVGPINAVCRRRLIGTR
jgi:hypothetical protein